MPVTPAALRKSSRIVKHFACQVARPTARPAFACEAFRVPSRPSNRPSGVRVRSRSRAKWPYQQDFLKNLWDAKGAQVAVSTRLFKKPLGCQGRYPQDFLKNLWDAKALASGEAGASWRKGGEGVPQGFS